MQKQTYYQLDTKNKTREWNIEVVPSTAGSFDIVINAGIMGGSMITTVTNISAGKGKKTIQEQAEFDAQSEINKKVKKGYTTSLTTIKPKTDTATIKAPMKGYLYDPKGEKNGLTLDKLGIRGTTIGAQRKFDGWRYRIHLTRTTCDFFTSSGDVTLEFPQISESLIKSFNKIFDYVNKKYGITEYFLDGEVYNHTLGFQSTASACGAGKNKTDQSQLSVDQKALRDQMHFHLFDVCMDAPYTTREKVLNYFYSPCVLQVETIKLVAEEKAIERLFEQFLAEGYEGLMIRMLDKPYEYKRTKQLTKYKPLMDDEFQIVDFYKSITGNTLGALWCVKADGQKFKANLKDSLGSDAIKQKMWDNKADYIGKWVTIEFLGYNEPKDGFKEGLPRHPRAKALRAGKSQD